MLKPAAIEDWYTFYHRTPVASYFQSPEWADVWMQYTGGRYQPSPLLASLPSGNTLLIPLTEQKIRWGLGSVWHASPAGTYGGFLSESGKPPDDEELSKTLCKLFGYCGSLVYRHFPFTASSVKDELDLSGRPQMDLSGRQQLDLSGRPQKTFSGSIRRYIPDEDAPHACDGVEIVPERTYYIACNDGYDAILKEWSDDHGKMIRKIKKARRSGIRIRRSVSNRDIAAYYNLYLANIRRWDPPPKHIYKQSFFEILLNKKPVKIPGFTISDANRPLSEMWLAEFGEILVAGAIVLTGRQHMTYWHGISDPGFYSYRPVNLLISEIIRECCNRGIPWFDFNPSMGISGVERFKKSFGADTADCSVVSRITSKIKLVSLAGDVLKRVKTGRGR